MKWLLPAKQIFLVGMLGLVEGFRVGKILGKNRGFSV